MQNIVLKTSNFHRHAEQSSYFCCIITKHQPTKIIKVAYIMLTRNEFSNT